MLMDINRNIEEYLSERSAKARYASFDFYFNYFQSFYEAGKIEALVQKDNMEMSCLQLGFCLSSWGM